jgi:hypothetical protein
MLLIQVSNYKIFQLEFEPFCRLDWLDCVIEKRKEKVHISP